MAVDKLLPESPRAYAYIVDFFGILVPGVTFVSFFLPIIFGGMNIIAFFNTDFNRSIIDALLSVKWEFTICVLILSYFFGIVFFRKGAGHVDKKSVRRQWDRIKKDNPPISNPDTVKWPYDNLRGYLEHRLPHLSYLIPWGECDKKKKNDFNPPCQDMNFGTSKTYMNAIKSNIRFWFPENYFVIARNEAHVRLSTSAWHAMNVLVYIALTAIVTISLLWFAEFKIDSNGVLVKKLHIYRSYLIFCATIVFIGFFIKRSIEKFVYYQRIREIVIILNIAHQANKQMPGFACELPCFSEVCRPDDYCHEIIFRNYRQGIQKDE